MGVSESKVVIETFSAACMEAEKNEKDDIEALLTNKKVCFTQYPVWQNTNRDKFISSLRNLWARIPVCTRRSIGRPQCDNLPIVSRKRPRKEHNSEITIPETFTKNVHRWKEFPLLFFTEDGSTLDLDDLPLARSYKYPTKVDGRRESDTIRSRFLKVMYYRLKDRLCIDQMRPNNVEKTAHIILNSGMFKRSCLSIIFRPDFNRQLHKNWNSVNDFFESTRGRFISNEEYELSIRRVKFDMNELTRVAAESVGSRECVHIEKFPDGMFNKTFQFTMANGAKVVGKVPNPNAG